MQGLELIVAAQASESLPHLAPFACGWVESVGIMQCRRRLHPRIHLRRRQKSPSKNSQRNHRKNP
ncbi:hypothetical protein Hanom_Chr09g00768491 [Helianthus anomalus]